MKSKKQLGIFSALFVALGATIGTGIVITQGSIVKATGSILISLIGWIIAGLLIVPQMMVQAEMVSAYPEAGGPYVFFKKARLKNMSFMYGWAYAIWGWPFSIAFRSYLTFIFLDTLIKSLTNFGGFDPWILRTISALTIIAFGMINYFSVKMGTAVNNILAMGKIALMLLIIFVAFSNFNGANFSGDIAKSIIGDHNNIVLIWFKGIAISVALAIWSYNGINSIAYMAPEFKNAKRNLPIIMISGALIIIAIYALFVVAIGGLLSASDAINKGIVDENVVSEALKKFNVKWITDTLILLLFVLSISTVFTYTKVAPHLPYAMAKDGLFFKSFDKLNKYNTPGLAIIFNTLFAALLSFIPYDVKFTVVFFTFGTATVNFLISLTILRCSKNVDYNPVYQIKHRKFVLSCSILSCILVAASGVYTSILEISNNLLFIFAPIASLAILTSAFPVYTIWQKIQNKKANTLEKTLIDQIKE